MVSKIYLKEKIIQLYHTDGKSTTDIAKIMNISQGTVYNQMRKLNIPIRSIKDSKLLWWRHQKEQNTENWKRLNAIIREK